MGPIRLISGRFRRALAITLASNPYQQARQQGCCLGDRLSLPEINPHSGVTQTSPSYSPVLEQQCDALTCSQSSPCTIKSNHSASPETICRRLVVVVVPCCATCGRETHPNDWCSCSILVHWPTANDRNEEPWLLFWAPPGNSMEMAVKSNVRAESYQHNVRAHYIRQRSSSDSQSGNQQNPERFGSHLRPVAKIEPKRANCLPILCLLFEHFPLIQ